MKIKLMWFRDIVANLIIAGMLSFMLSLTYVGGVLNVFSSNDNEVVFRGNINNNNVSFMINVYWGTEYLDEMLEILNEKQVKATFFVGGMWVEKNNEMLLKMVENGHEIANHGYFHKDHKNLSFQQNEEEIYITHNLVETITGIKMNLFAPPSGSYSQTTLKVASSLGYRVIMWSKDTIDWRDKDSSKIFANATKNAQNGDLILMHPIKETKDVLADIIDFYLQKGFYLTTVTQNIAL